MKIVTVVGARPQFIKAAVVSRQVRKIHREILVHTGQHYDYNMSERFFDELDIPRPDYNLGISGGTHAEMTGRMLIELEKVLVKERPDALLVYGDTNSTLAAALAAAKLHIPVCHVEAGTRTHSMTNPEELNRICTDHLSTLLIACTKPNLDNLVRENLAERSLLVGDPMLDAFVMYSQKADRMPHILTCLDGHQREIPEQFFYLTCHREENTQDDAVLKQILCAMEQLEHPVIYPVHPRNKERAARICTASGFHNVILTEPVGYLTSVYLTNHAEKIVTDSGGLQREAFFAEKKCVTVLNFEVWPETMVDGRNELSSPETQSILKALSNPQHVDETYRPFGDGRASPKIVSALERLEHSLKS
ncbi:non-hydrolyzing UDP-N-acetylglucosamine 2-epimerase [Candidatus Allofournierella merdipullorum]|uniref:non-hydrolyzing UDP-N-acetylglucosamine 2-epimerase n=1 Tax=Candidatus Allofournierella merdipullorum TaxID=2838595 RepID=UPI002A8A62B0|nr:UDP-N-acetylglucosamine 2-epimerase (non-hydrolyzing) [Candidatus Fournierella merdipullorum]